MPIYLTQPPPRFVRDLVGEARAKRLRRQNQPRRDSGILQSPRRMGSSTVFSARVARTGPMTYLDGQGRAHTETRDSDELRRIVAQLPNTPVVLNHPTDGMISQGSKHPIAGKVLSAYFEDGDPAYAVCDLQVDDPKVVQAISDGKAKEVSLGYLCDVLDGKTQTNTAVDHVALVGAARCGASCSVRTDAHAHASCSCGCGSCSTTSRKTDMNPDYNPDPDPQDLAHRSDDPSQEVSWMPLDANADAADLKTRLQRFPSYRFASDADREAARADLLAAARRVGLDALARAHQVQWSTGAGDPMTDEDAAQERARNRSADAYHAAKEIK